MSAPVDTDRVRAEVSACSGVARVHGRGPNGVSADDHELEVHIVATYGVSLPDLAERIGATLAPLLGGRSLTLVVEDVQDPDEPDDLGPVAGLPALDAAGARPALGTADVPPALPAPEATAALEPPPERRQLPPATGDPGADD